MHGRGGRDGIGGDNKHAAVRQETKISAVHEV